MINVCVVTADIGAHHKLITTQPSLGIGHRGLQPAVVFDVGTAFRQTQPGWQQPGQPLQHQGVACRPEVDDFTIGFSDAVQRFKAKGLGGKVMDELPPFLTPVKAQMPHIGIGRAVVALFCTASRIQFASRGG